MTEEQLRSMSEQEIRARFRCAPAYYLQAKLEKKWALEGRETRNGSPNAGAKTSHATRSSRAPVDAALFAPQDLDMADCWDPSVAEPWQLVARREPASLDVAGGKAMTLDLPLPGFEILDAALAETEGDGAIFAETTDDAHDAELTQAAILEAALEDYGNWPFSSADDARRSAAAHAQADPETAPQPETKVESDLERKLELVLSAEPELRLVLDAEPELEVVLHSEPALEQALDAETGFVSDNVTLANFGNRAPRTVPVVSVAMDRKRPNMVRVVGMSTRLAS